MICRYSSSATVRDPTTSKAILRDALRGPSPRCRANPCSVANPATVAAWAMSQTVPAAVASSTPVRAMTTLPIAQGAFVAITPRTAARLTVIRVPIASTAAANATRKAPAPIRHALRVAERGVEDAGGRDIGDAVGAGDRRVELQASSQEGVGGLCRGARAVRHVAAWVVIALPPRLLATPRSHAEVGLAITFEVGMRVR